ncbi:hypothetical protein ADUPG1_009141, partial [Aduncisulcus paluster]
YTRETDSSYCSCDEGWYGQDCGQVCPLDPYYGLVCGGHGSCATSHGISECVCDQNWFGPSCAEKCPVDDKGVVCSGYTCLNDFHECECPESDEYFGYYGSACQFNCGLNDNISCYHGVCTLNVYYDTLGVEQESISCDCNVWYRSSKLALQDMYQLCDNLSGLSITLIIVACLAIVAAGLIIWYRCRHKNDIAAKTGEKGGLLENDKDLETPEIVI